MAFMIVVTPAMASCAPGERLAMGRHWSPPGGPLLTDREFYEILPKRLVG